ncbi:unnamed protein product, partial [Laminaria digitata]
ATLSIARGREHMGKNFKEGREGIGFGHAGSGWWLRRRLAGCTPNKSVSCIEYVRLNLNLEFSVFFGVRRGSNPSRQASVSFSFSFSFFATKTAPRSSTQHKAVAYPYTPP